MYIYIYVYVYVCINIYIYDNTTINTYMYMCNIHTMDGFRALKATAEDKGERILSAVLADFKVHVHKVHEPRHRQGASRKQTQPCRWLVVGWFP